MPQNSKGIEFILPFQKINKFRLVDFFIHCESNGISSTIALLSLYLISPSGLYIITLQRVSKELSQ